MCTSQQYPEVAASAEHAARIVLQTPKQSHAKPMLCQLHWLPVQHRIDYKVSLLTCKILNTTLPPYLSQRINCPSTHRHNAQRLRIYDLMPLSKYDYYYYYYHHLLCHCSSTCLLAPTSQKNSFVCRLSGTRFLCMVSEATHCLISKLD